jgi:hypothetical protein
MGGLAAGQYAVLALVLLGASLLINTIAQRAGPDAIKRVYQGHMGAAVKRVLGWIAVTTVVWLGAIGAFAVLLENAWLPSSLARYAIDTELLLPLAASGVLLNTSLVEFLLIGLDRERAFVGAAAAFLVIVLGAALAVYIAHGGLWQLMWALVICRTTYAVILTSILVPAVRNRISPA